MNKQGALAQFETHADAEAAGYKTKLTKAEAQHLQGVNRHERRAELARLRCEARRKSKGSRR